MNLDVPKTLPVGDMERFVAKIDGYGLGGCCWSWRGPVSRSGYARFHLTVDGVHRRFYAHRISYGIHVGPIPEGLQIDHICRNRRCVNPEHLEVVTNRENVLRGTHPYVLAYHANQCTHGHSLEDAYIHPKAGTRMCRTCRAQRKRGQQPC